MQPAPVTPNIDIEYFSLSNCADLHVAAHMRGAKQSVELHLYIKELIGRGSFGYVYKAHMMSGTHQLIALKQVEIDERFQQREVQILEKLNHCNIVKFLFSFQVSVFSPDGESIKHFNMLGLEYVHMSLLSYLNDHIAKQMAMPLLYVRLLTYQLFRALAYLKSQFVCHRDIKPDNMLINRTKCTLKVADFGSAKYINPGQPTKSLTYMCSRMYRAPELFAKCENYGTEVDLWSAGCILAELLQGKPLFDNHKASELQLLFIISLLGSAGLEHAPSAHAYYQSHNVDIPAGSRNWSELLNREVPDDLVDLLNQCLQYAPHKRIQPIEACAHPAFNELRVMKALKMQLPNGEPLPQLFNFAPHEVTINSPLWSKLVLPAKENLNVGA